MNKMQPVFVKAQVIFQVLYGEYPGNLDRQLMRAQLADYEWKSSDFQCFSGEFSYPLQAEMPT